MSARVVRVQSDSDEYPEWEITVVREPIGRYVGRADVKDVPSDVRAALREWLEGGES